MQIYRWYTLDYTQQRAPISRVIPLVRPRSVKKQSKEEKDFKRSRPLRSAEPHKGAFIDERV